MKNKTAIFVCLLLVCCMLVASAVVVAPKPDKPGKPPKDPPPPPPEGTVYFTTYNGVDRDMWTMNPDGSGKTQLGVYEGIDGGNKAFGEISRLQHGDHYWFIRFETVGGKYPDGRLVREIFAVRDDGTMEVQLTNDPTLETISYARALVWSINDESIAWSAFRWVDGSIDMDSFGIYSAGISFDANGDVSGLSEEPTLIWNTGYYESDPPYIPNVKRFDFSPDGSEIVYVKFNKVGSGGGTWDIFVVDLVAQSETDIGTNGYRVKWSPDGSKIAIIEASSLVTVNPDGTDKQVLVEYSQKGNTFRRVKDEMGWSPDSNYLHYTWDVCRYGNDGLPHSKYSVHRIEADGDNPTSMTGDLPDDTYPHAHAWR